MQGAPRNETVMEMKTLTQHKEWSTFSRIPTRCLGEGDVSALLLFLISHFAFSCNFLPLCSVGEKVTEHQI